MSNADIQELLKPKAVGRPTKRPDSTMLMMLYQTQTSTQLAEYYGVSVHTIRNWLRYAKDELRKKLN